MALFCGVTGRRTLGGAVRDEWAGFAREKSIFHQNSPGALATWIRLLGTNSQMKCGQAWG